MAKRSVKTMFSSLLLAFIFVVGACIGGFYFFIHLIVKNYKDPNLDAVIEQTANNEGFCLSDIAQENGITFTSMTEFYKDACVSIIVEVNDVGMWLGSGVCVASKGYTYGENKTIESGSYIVTNYHVIEEIYLNSSSDYKIEVYPNDYTNEERYGTTVPYEAEVLWSDSYLDSAIIYVKENIDWIRMKDRSIKCEDNEKLKDNERAFVIGSPKKLENQNTVTTGSISQHSLNYSYTVDEIETLFGYKEVLSNVYECLIPIQIVIAGGNSGGGLFDGNGYLVGQPTLGTSESSSAVNYAIPIYPVMLIINDLIDSKEVKGELLKTYSIDYLNTPTIDYYEADIMATCFDGTKKYYYGKEYYSSELEYSRDTGLKVLANNETYGLEKGDIILSIKINENTEEISCRNDLIFELLKCRKGDIIQLQIEGKADINVTLA